MAEEYIRLNLDILNSDLSPRAIILYSFYEYRIEYSKFEVNGEKYIIPSGYCNPQKVLGYSERLVIKLKNELISKGYIKTKYVESSGRYKAIFLSKEHRNKNVSLTDTNMSVKPTQICQSNLHKNVSLTDTNMSTSLYIKEKQKEKEKNNKKDGAPTSDEIYIPTDEQIEEVLKKL